MKKTALKSGLRVIYNNTKSDIICINVSVLVGSNNEPDNLMGISHFIEHMVFEGTSSRTAEEISAEIEKYGGDLNAYTSSEKTNFYIKIHKKHAEKAFEILSDIIINPKFDESAIKKEKNVVLGEIDMIYDEPRNYQWILFGKNLLQKPFSNPEYGTKETVNSLTRKDLLDYHKEFYTPGNTIITVVGDCNNYNLLISKYFAFKNQNKSIKKLFCDVKNSRKICSEKRENLTQQYLIIGYQTPIRSDKASYALDIVKAILGKGQSGKLFVEIRTKRGLAYDLGVYHSPGKSCGFFAFYASASKENIALIEQIFFTELKNLNNISEKDLNEAKSFIEGQLTLKIEDSQDHADLISMFEESSSCTDFEKYLINIKKVTKNDIKNCLREYLNEKYTKVMLI